MSLETGKAKTRRHEPPRWMRNAQTCVFTLNVLLALSFFAFLWLVPIDGPAEFERIVAPWNLTSNPSLIWLVPHPFELFIIGCVVATIVLERQTDDRFEPLILIGVMIVLIFYVRLLFVLNHVAFSGGHPVRIGPHFWMAGAGVALVILGCIRVLFDVRRRGALIGLCTVGMTLSTIWWCHHLLYAPTSVQRSEFFAVYDLPIVPLASPMPHEFLVARDDDVAPFFEVQRVDGEPTYYADGREVEFAEVEEFLAENIIPGQHAGIGRGPTIFVRAACNARVGDVLRVMEFGRTLGATQFRVVVNTSPLAADGQLYLSFADDGAGPSESEVEGEPPLALTIAAPSPSVPMLKHEGKLYDSIAELLGESGVEDSRSHGRPRHNAIVDLDPRLEWGPAIEWISELFFEHSIWVELRSN